LRDLFPSLKNARNLFNTVSCLRALVLSRSLAMRLITGLDLSEGSRCSHRPRRTQTCLRACTLESIFFQTTPAICKADNITNDVKGRAPCVPSCFCANTQKSASTFAGLGGPETSGLLALCPSTDACVLLDSRYGAYRSRGFSKHFRSVNLTLGQKGQGAMRAIVLLCKHARVRTLIRRNRAGQIAMLDPSERNIRSELCLLKQVRDHISRNLRGFDHRCHCASIILQSLRRDQ
jgi:hypothetical protein